MAAVEGIFETISEGNLLPKIWASGRVMAMLVTEDFEYRHNADTLEELMLGQDVEAESDGYERLPVNAFLKLGYGPTDFGFPMHIVFFCADPLHFHQGPYEKRPGGIVIYQEGDLPSDTRPILYMSVPEDLYFVKGVFRRRRQAIAPKGQWDWLVQVPMMEFRHPTNAEWIRMHGKHSLN